MIILISGGCKNGKSSLAQKIACDLAKNEGPDSHLVYFATMIPQDGEDDERIKKHREDREGLGFETIESGKDIDIAAQKLKEKSIVLFDSLTALTANELFSGSESKDEQKVMQKLQKELTVLIEKASSVVFVSDAIYSDGKIYGELTERYRQILADTENFIAKKSDRVMEMTGGITHSEKQFSDTLAQSGSDYALVIGGAYQGKTEWAKSAFSLSDEDIFACTDSSAPDFSKKCLTHYENYIAYCLKNDLSAKTDFSDCTKTTDDTCGIKKIIICDDIFCGVVPIDAFQRKLREETGLALQKIAEKAEVTRIFCGIPERLSKPNLPSSRTSIEHVAPRDIERTSFSIIGQELLMRNISLPERLSPVIMRVIHTTADFEFARTLSFSPDVLQIIEEAIRNGADIVTDTNMALSGINKKTLARFGGEVHCFMADEDVAEKAKAQNLTRAAISMRKASGIKKPLIFAIGNAPTALVELCALMKDGFSPVAVIGVPVGFVNVVAAKEMIMESGVPYIVNTGRKGGSTVAAAICNAILYNLANER